MLASPDGADVTECRSAATAGYVALILFSNAVPGVPAYQVSWPELRTTLHESANLFYIVRCIYYSVKIGNTAQNLFAVSLGTCLER